MSQSIFVVSLGCPKNLVDTEKMLGAHFPEYSLVNQPEAADVILVNTCSFILPAKEESIETIFEFADLKKKYPEKRVVVTGCLWEQYKEKIEEEIPEVEFLSNKDIFLSSNRLVTTSGFSYLKIAEGCNRACSFCTIPLFKGPHKSRPMTDILNEARALEGKVQELIVVSQDTSFYGIDTENKPMLPRLIEELSDMNFPWIRILYFYPQNVSPEIIQLMAQKSNICKYLDLPFQHLSDPILKSMNRWGNYEIYKNLIYDIRDKIPEISIRSSFIVGYPGESEKDFNFLLQGLDELKLNRAGFFMYSDEEEAPSFQMPGKVGEDTIEERYSKAVFYQEEISEELLEKRLKTKETVLIESKDENTGLYIGRSQFEAPEIDGLIYVKSNKELKSGEMVPVIITDSDNHNLWGEKID